MGAKRPELVQISPEQGQIKTLESASSINSDSMRMGHTQSEEWGSGIFTLGHVLGEPVKFLVDTGAAVSVLSLSTYQKLDAARKPELKATDLMVCGVAGEPLDLAGRIDVTIVLGGVPFQHEMIVTDLGLEGILGQDIMLRNQGRLDLSQLTLKLGKSAVNCWVQGERDLSCRCIVAEDVFIPPWSERLIPVEIPNAGFLPECGLIQPSTEFISARELLPLPGIVSTRQDHVYIRVVNFGDEEAHLHPRTCIGNCEPYYDESMQRKPTDTELHIGALESCSFPDHLTALFEDSSSELTAQEKDEFKAVLLRYEKVFAKDKNDLGRCNLMKHKINTGTALPIRKPPRRLPLGKRQAEKEEIQSMLEKGVIQPSTSPWSAPIVLVTKKDGSIRFCVDYRALNDVTIKDAYPLPRIDASLDALAGNQWFCTMDLMSGYWQIAMDEQDQEKTAFATSLGLYEFKTLPFGLANAPANFERLMESVLRGLQWEECLVYIDDIIIPGISADQCLLRLDHVLQRLESANLKLKPSKCSFFKRSVIFLGHIVSSQGIQTDPSKVEAVRTWPVPSNKKHIRSFLGLCSYYRKFIQGFASIARPLHKLTEKDAPFQWDKECQASFDQLKKALSEAPILAYPNQEKDVILDTDASGEAVGAVLSQQQDGVEKVVGYFSKALSRSEREYCVTRKELLAVVLAVKHFHPYIYGRRVTLRTDNAAVSWMKSLKVPTGQTARWLELLGTYDLNVTHRPGRTHNNADALSRRPCSSCENQEKIQQVYLQEIDCQDTQDVNRGENDTAVDEAKYDKNTPDDKRSMEAKRDVAEVFHPVVAAVTTRSKDTPLMGDLRCNQGWLDGWDVEHMRLIQLSDTDMGPMMLDKEAGSSRPSWENISHLSSGYKTLWSNWENIEIRGGLLFKKYFAIGNTTKWQLLVPSPKRKEVFNHFHAHNTGGHLGVDRTLHRIKLAFYWPGMSQDVSKWCMSCGKCAARKPSLRKNKAPLKQYQVGEPLERIAMDLLGPLPLTRRGNRHVLVIGDYFTKWMEAIALPDQDTETVAKAVVEEFICRYGTPRQLHTDRGTCFESNLFRSICKLLNIEKTKTTARHPRSDGMVERFNRTLASMLTMYCEEDQKSWDEHLPYVMLAYRSSVHSSTGFSPNMMMLGRETELPLQVVVGTPESGKQVEPVEYVEVLQSKLREAHNIAREHLKRSAEHQKRSYDKQGATSRQFNIGQAVWYYNPVIRKGICKKLTSPWRGPYVVVKKLNDVTYLIQRTARARPIASHVDKLKEYKGEERPAWFKADTVSV